MKIQLMKSPANKVTCIESIGEKQTCEELDFIDTRGLADSLSESSSQVSEYPSEYSAIEIRGILQALFPERRLVLSQFTYYLHAGVSNPSGETIRRKRRCYRLEDLLPIAVVLYLKEQGIPLKNINNAPQIVQDNSAYIFSRGQGCRLSGFADQISLFIPGVSANRESSALNAFLEDSLQSSEARRLFWSVDVGLIAEQLIDAASKRQTSEEVGKTEQSEVIQIRLAA